MRVWTVRPSVAEGENWIVECDGRVMAMLKDEADAQFIVAACNAYETTADDTFVIIDSIVTGATTGTGE